MAIGFSAGYEDLWRRTVERQPARNPLNAQPQLISYDGQDQATAE